MKKEALTVRCTYTDTGDSLTILLEKSFRLFLLRTFAEKSGNVRSLVR